MLRELLIEIGIDVKNDPISELNKEIDDLIKKLKKLDASKIEDLDKIFKEIAESTEDINKNLKNMNKRFKDVNKTAKKFEKNVEDIADGIRKADKRTEDLNDSLKYSERKVEELEDGFKDTNKQVKKLVDNIEDIEKETKRVTKETKKFNDSIEDITKEADRLNDTFKDITNAASRLSREIDSISFGGLQSEIRRLESAFGGVVRAAQKASSEAKDIGQGASSAVGDVGKLERAFEKVESTVDSIKNKIDSMNGRIAGLAGTVAGVAGASVLTDRALRDSTLETQIKISMKDVDVDAVKKKVKTLTALGMDEIEALEATRRQYALNANASEQMNNQILDSAATMVRAYPMLDLTELIQETHEIGKELGIASDEAIAMANSLLKIGFPPEQIDIISEYGKQMQLAGFSAEQIQGVMAAGVETGTWNIDNLLDGVKEGRLQLASFTEGWSNALQGTIDDLGLSSDKLGEWAEAIASGGENGFETLQEVARYINDITDAGLQNDLATHIFGTKWEDQGFALLDAIINADNHIQSLSDSQKQLNEDMGMLKADPAYRLAEAMNRINEAMQPIYGDVIDIVEGFADWIEKNPDAIRDTLQAIREAATPIVETLVDITRKTADWIGKNPELVKTFMKVAAVLAPIGIILGGIVTMLGGALAAVGTLLTTIHTVKGFKGVMADTARNIGGNLRDARNSGGLGNWFKNRKSRREQGTMRKPQSTLLGRVFDSMMGRNNKRTPVQQGSTGNPWDDLRRESEEYLRNNPMNDDTGLLTASSELIEAAYALQRAASWLESICCGGPGGGGAGGRRGRGGRGGRRSPVDDLNGKTSKGGRLSRLGDGLKKLNPFRKGGAAGNQGGFIKGAGGKLLGVAGTALGALTLAGQIKAGDGRGASETGGMLAGGLAGAKLGAIAGSFAGPIGTAIGGAAGGIIGSIGGSALGAKLYDGIKSFDWNGLKSVASNTGQAISNTWNSLKTATGNAWEGIKSGVSSAFTKTKDTVSNTASAIGGGLSTAWNFVKNGASTAWDSMKTSVSEKFTSAKNAVSNTASALGGGLSSIWGGIKSVAGGAWNGVKSTLSNSMNSAKSTVSNTASALSSGLSATWNTTKTVASNTWNNLKSDMSAKSTAAKTAVSNAFNTMKSGLSSTWNSLKSIASSAWSGITSAITSSVSSAVSKATSLLGGLKSAVAGAASNVWNKITSAASKAKKWVNGSHATGLGRVPFDGYIAELHKNEAVLTANQANALRSAGLLKGDGVAPQLNIPQATVEAAEYSPLGVDPSTTATTSTTNNNGTVRASVTINVDGSEAPQETAKSIKDELESWFSSLSTVFPATLEG